MLPIKPSLILVLTTMFRLITSFSAPLTKIPRRSLALFATADKPIPTILLAGFLGSGKTTTLKHLLENNQSIKIGTIVNDVASVNIDAKLIGNTDSFNDSMSNGVIELQNGCACCSLADELMESVMQLTSGEGGKRRELDAIVVELSGVADPVAVRDNWKMAELVSFC
jgi:G3E family GTPase